MKATSLVVYDGKMNGSPAIEIAELSVDKDHEGNDNGSILLKFALRLCDELRDQIGIKYLLACAEKNDVGFYKDV